MIILPINQSPIQGGGNVQLSCDNLAFQSVITAAPIGATASGALITNNSSSALTVIFDATQAANPLTQGFVLAVGESMLIQNKAQLENCFVISTFPGPDILQIQYFIG